MLFAQAKVIIHAFSIGGIPADSSPPPPPSETPPPVVRRAEMSGVPRVRKVNRAEIPPPPRIPGLERFEDEPQSTPAPAPAPKPIAKPITPKQPHRPCECNFKGLPCPCGDECECPPFEVVKEKPAVKPTRPVVKRPASTPVQETPHVASAEAPRMGSWGRPAAKEFKPYLVQDAARTEMAVRPVAVDPAEAPFSTAYQAVNPVQDWPTVGGGLMFGGSCPGGNCSTPMGGFSFGGSCPGGNCR